MRPGEQHRAQGQWDGRSNVPAEFVHLAWSRGQACPGRRRTELQGSARPQRAAANGRGSAPASPDPRGLPPAAPAEVSSLCREHLAGGTVCESVLSNEIPHKHKFVTCCSFSLQIYQNTSICLYIYIYKRLSSSKSQKKKKFLDLFI